MSLAKGSVQADAAMTNSFSLEVVGLPETLWKRFGAMSEELITAVMADQTVQTTGTTKAIETDGDQYAHHTLEVLAIEAWWLLCKTGGPLNKRAALLHAKNANGQIVRSWLLDGMLLTGRETPEFDAGADGAPVLIKWKFSIDSMIPM